MTELAAVPWPDAVGRPAPRISLPAYADQAPDLHPRTTWALSLMTGLILSGGWVVFVIGPEGARVAGGLVVGLFMPSYVIGIVLLARGGWASVRAIAAVPTLWVLVAVACASVMWSVAPALTARRAPALVMTSLAGVALAARLRWADLTEVLATTFAVVVTVCFLLTILAPTWGKMQSIFPGAWRGVWFDKNALGDHMTTGVCVLVAAAVLRPKRALLWAVFALGALALIVLSTSKTALVTLMFGLSVLAFVALVRRGGAPAVLATFAAVSLLAVVAFLIVFERDALFRLLGKDATLTGRTGIWTGALRQIAKRPLLGFGYSAVWEDPSRWGPIHWIMKDAKYRPPHAHNSWIEIRLALGWVGLGAFAAMFVQAWVRLGVATYFRGGEAGRGAWLAAPILAVWSIQSLTESVAIGYNDFNWLMLTAVCAALGRPRPRPAAGPSPAAGASMATP